MPMKRTTRLSVELVRGSVPQWIRPSLEEEREEIERTAKDLDIDFKELVLALQEAPLVDLNDEQWKKLRNSDSWETMSLESVRKQAEMYGRNWKSIISAFKSGKPLPAAIVILTSDWPYLVAGNTRLMVARALKVRPQVLMADMEDQ